jgi:hypothetical protein
MSGSRLLQGRRHLRRGRWISLVFEFVTLVVTHIRFSAGMQDLSLGQSKAKTFGRGPRHNGRPEVHGETLGTALSAIWAQLSASRAEAAQLASMYYVERKLYDDVLI